MRPIDADSLIRETCRVATKAGTLIQRIRAEGFETTRKADESPVTRADREADALLQTELLKLEPVAWLSEETADSKERLDSERVWVVDPLDGTKEFTKAIPEYCVAVALVERGEPILGVIHNPATGEIFSAARGRGAHRNDAEIRVQEGRALLASRSETRRGEFEPFEEGWDVQPLGSIEYKLARIAAGKGGVTFSRGPKHEWDVCAGVILVQEAGGLATDLFGDPLRFNNPFPKVRGILAGAPASFARALEQVRRIGASDRMAELDDAEGTATDESAEQ